MEIPSHVLDQIVATARDEGVTPEHVDYAIGVLVGLHKVLCEGRPAAAHVHMDALSGFLSDSVDHQLQIKQALS